MTPRKKKRPRPVIGWREWAALPELGIERIKAKIDTGARTSTIHAWNIALEERPDGRWVTFDLHPVQRNNAIIFSCKAPLFDMREIRSSSGHAERRYVIETTLRLGKAEWPIHLSLTNRDEMGFRMLLGRTALRNRVIINPGRSFLATRENRPKGRHSA
jgi:hypothetical protein